MRFLAVTNVERSVAFYRDVLGFEVKQQEEGTEAVFSSCSYAVLLVTELGLALIRHGQLGSARVLLDRAVRDLERVLGRDHHWRLRTLAALRDLLVKQGEYGKAAVVQEELLKSLSERFGVDHPNTLASRSNLARIHLMTTRNDNRRM
jgi:catechol 2,3-dioxygenase-like lactoylglutathione lyase family enzyme